MKYVRSSAEVLREVHDVRSRRRPADTSDASEADIENWFADVNGRCGRALTGSFILTMAVDSPIDVPESYRPATSYGWSQQSSMCLLAAPAADSSKAETWRAVRR